MTEKEVEELAEDILEIVEDHVGLGVNEAQRLKEKFIEAIKRA